MSSASVGVSSVSVDISSGPCIMRSGPVGVLSVGVDMCSDLARMCSGGSKSGIKEGQAEKSVKAVWGIACSTVPVGGIHAS